MADLKPISQFATASSVEANTLLFVSTPNQNNGYDSEKVSAGELGEALVNDFEYTQDLSTVDKTVVGAINELNSRKADFVTPTGYTLNNQFIDISDSYLNVRKVGNLCFLNGRLKLTNAVANNYGLAFNLPTASVESLMLIHVSSRDFNNKATTFVVSCIINNGTLTIQTYPDTIESGNYLYIDSFYITS